MPVSRKLVAVVMADVVGYSRLMERDEAGTHARLRELREKLIDPKIAEHGGRTVHTSGDGTLIEFPSATSALRCAVEVQRELGVRNLYLAPLERIEFRIGINLGDVIVEGSDIIGDGVNVAARLEALAEPGGICVASAVWEQVHEDLGIEFIDSGEQHVKNISKPIRVFRVALGKGTGKAKPNATAGVPPTAATTRRSGRSRTLIAAGAVLLVVAALAAWQFGARPNSAPAATASAPPPRSIMVLPFRAPADDATLRALADSLTNDMRRALADTVRDASIVPADEAAVTLGSGADKHATGRNAKAHYLVEGDVLASGDDIVVTTRLVDAVRSKQMGSERRTIPRSSLGQDREQLVARLTFATRDLFDNAERQRTESGVPSSATAQDLVARGELLMRKQNPSELRDARKLYDEAIRREPSLTAAWVGRANVLFVQFLTDYTADRGRLLAEIDRDSLRAIALDDHDPTAWYARSLALTAQLRFDSAFEANDRARALDPTRFFLLRGYLYLLTGRAAEALKVSESRQSMLGIDPSFLTLACTAHLYLGNYQQAIADCERAVSGDDSSFPYLHLTAAYAQVGDMAKAATAKAELMRRLPDFTIARFVARQTSNNPTWVRQTETQLIPGLRKAGVPE